MFPETVKRYLAGGEIAAAWLCRFDFRDATKRAWLGFGDLEAGGHLWQGIGSVVAIDGIARASGTEAAGATFTLSTEDREIMTAAAGAADQVSGRRCSVAIQFFETAASASKDGGVQVGACLDLPVVVWAGRMDQIVFAKDGPSLRTITLTAETLFANRNRPPYGLYTAGDQRARFPGDRGLDRIAALESKTVSWPDLKS